MRSFTRAQQMTKATLDLSPIRHSILGPKMSEFILWSVISAAQRSTLARRSRDYQIRAERYCVSLLSGESCEVPGQHTIAHQFPKSPDVDIYAQRVNITLLCRITRWIR